MYVCVISFSGHVSMIFFHGYFFYDRDCLSASTEGPCCSVNGAWPTAGLGIGSRGTERERERGGGGTGGARTKTKKNVSGIKEETGRDISVP